MRVLVTGYAGQLGWDTVRQLEARGIECRGVDMQDFDLTDGQAVKTMYRSSARPSLSIALPIPAWTKRNRSLKSVPPSTAWVRLMWSGPPSA